MYIVAMIFQIFCDDPIPVWEEATHMSYSCNTK